MSSTECQEGWGRILKFPTCQFYCPRCGVGRQPEMGGDYYPYEGAECRSCGDWLCEKCSNAAGDFKCQGCGVLSAPFHDINAVPF